MLDADLLVGADLEQVITLRQVAQRCGVRAFEVEIPTQSAMSSSCSCRNRCSVCASLIIAMASDPAGTSEMCCSADTMDTPRPRDSFDLDRITFPPGPPNKCQPS